METSLRSRLRRLSTPFVVAILSMTLLGCGIVGTQSPTPLPPTMTPTILPSTPTFTPTVKPSPTTQPTSTATPKPPTATPITGPLALTLDKGLPQTGMVALTMDIGVKGAGAVPRTLDILKENGLHATIFVIGVWAETNPELVRRIVAEGHEIGNHSYDHPDLTTISDAEIVDQIQRTETLVKQAAGVSTKPYMRPPFGSYDNRVRAILEQQGYSMVMWTLDSTDWRDDSTVDSVIAYTTSKAKAGDIIICHAHADKTADALPSIISGLKAKGLTIGNLSQVLGR